MGKNKKLICVAGAMLLLFIAFHVGRQQSFVEITGTDTEDVIFAELNGYGKTVCIEDNEQIQELMNTLRGIGFNPTLQNGTRIPGGVTISITLALRDGNVECITLPYYSNIGRSFITSTKAIRCFDKWFQ